MVVMWRGGWKRLVVGGGSIGDSSNIGTGRGQ